MLQNFLKTSKEKKFLNRKTKRENFLTPKTSRVPKTKITLIYLSEIPFNSNDYSYIKFSFSDKINLAELIQNKVQSLIFDITSNKIYIIDRIELENEDGSKKESFIISIYLKKTNIWYINLKPKKKGYHFEIIFYSNSMDKLPNYLEYKNRLELKKFDEYELKYRKKMSVINVEKNFAYNYINTLNLDANSYKICVRIKENEKILSSVHELKIGEKTTSIISKKQANTKHISKIFELFEELKKNKSIESLKEKYKDLDNDDAFKRFIKSYIYIKKHYSEIRNIKDNDVNLLKEYILKLIIKYFFIDTTNKKYSKKNIINKLNKMRLKVIDNITQIFNDIEQFTENKEKSLVLKYRLYRATLYNLYSAIHKYSTKKPLCLKILSKYDQKILDINSCSNKNPYNNAIKFLKKVADNLNENSCLFDLLMQYNSGISDDIKLLSRKNSEIDVDCARYELSMQTVEEIVNHLKNILPSFIIRYTSDKDNYAFYSCVDDLIFINEKRAFKNDILTDLDDCDENILPIVFLLLHECWGHKKVASSYIIARDSPIRNNLKIDDFDENIIFVKNEDNEIIKGESGFEMEYLITGIKYSNIISRHILNNEDENNEKLLNVKLWVQPNFLELQELVVKNIKEFYNYDTETFLRKNREEEDNPDNKKNNLEIYFEDDVEIGILYKP